jgi:hypothetical protein
MSNNKLRKGLGVVVMGYALALVSPTAQAFSWASVLKFFQTMQVESSSWAVTTQQTALSANQSAESSVTSKKQLATAMGTIAASKRIGDAVMSVDGSYGQPVSIKCTAQTAATMQVEAWSQVALDRSKLMGTFASARVADQGRAERERLALHLDSYCTVGDAKAGMCQLKANGMQGWDVNYGGAFGESTLPAEGELAGYAYAAMVSDTRADQAIDCKSTACAAAAAQQLGRSAMGTMVADAFLGQVLERRVPMLTGQ